MAIIKIPKTPPEAYDPNRRVSALLKMQVLHLREAEKMFPPKHHSNIYINAIKTEAAASEYIGYVTAKIRQLHEEAAGRRVARVPARIPAIAAAAGGNPAKKSKADSPAKATAKRAANSTIRTQKKK